MELTDFSVQKEVIIWTPQKVPGNDPEIMDHHLNVDPKVRPAMKEILLNMNT